MPIPNPPKQAHVHEIHGHRREDAYAWLRERDSVEVETPKGHKFLEIEQVEFK